MKNHVIKLIMLNIILGITITGCGGGDSEVETSLRKLSQLEDERESQSRTSYKITEVDLNRLWEVASSMQDGEVDTNQNLLLVSQLQELQLADSNAEKIREEINSIAKQIIILKTSLAGTGEMER
jgi:hypothetical protein